MQNNLVKGFHISLPLLCARPGHVAPDEDESKEAYILNTVYVEHYTGITFGTLNIRFKTRLWGRGFLKRGAEFSQQGLKLHHII